MIFFETWTLTLSYCTFAFSYSSSLFLKLLVCSQQISEIIGWRGPPILNCPLYCTLHTRNSTFLLQFQQLLLTFLVLMSSYDKDYRRNLILISEITFAHFATSEISASEKWQYFWKNLLTAGKASLRHRGIGIFI